MLVYDLEIANPIDDGRTVCVDGITYANGWRDYRGMGIACVCSYDLRSQRWRVFDNKTLPYFGELVANSECVVGFNNHRFDDEVLRAQGIMIEDARSYDILKEVYRGLGVLHQQYKPKGYTLSDLAKTNFGLCKSGNGADAPFEWQSGNIGSVIDYCLYDVHLTYKLIDRIIRCGYIFDPNNPKNKIHLSKPGSFFAQEV